MCWQNWSTSEVGNILLLDHTLDEHRTIHIAACGWNEGKFSSFLGTLSPAFQEGLKSQLPSTLTFFTAPAKSWTAFGAHLPHQLSVATTLNTRLKDSNCWTCWINLQQTTSSDACKFHPLLFTRRDAGQFHWHGAKGLRFWLSDEANNHNVQQNIWLKLVLCCWMLKQNSHGHWWSNHALEKHLGAVSWHVCVHLLEDGHPSPQSVHPLKRSCSEVCNWGLHQSQEQHQFQKRQQGWCWCKWAGLYPISILCLFARKSRNLQSKASVFCVLDPHIPWNSVPSSWQLAACAACHTTQ